VIFDPGLAEAADAEVTDDGFGGDKDDRHLVTQLAFGQHVMDFEDELVGGAKTARARRTADHHGPGIVEERRPGVSRLLCFGRRHQRMTGTIEGTQPGYSFVGAAVAGGDYEMVVVEGLRRGVNLPLLGIDSPNRRRDEADPLARQGTLQVE
jgi:hypothetical protein